MDDDSSIQNGLPPKLDLRRKVITPLNTLPTTPVPATDVAAEPVSPVMTSPLQGSSVIGNDVSRGTIRISLSDASQTIAASPEPTPPEPTVQPPSQPEVVADQGDLAATPSSPGVSGPRPLIRPVMAPKTIKLKKPVPLGIKRDTPDPAAPLGSKRATSKISLPSADADAPKAPTPTMPQPIRIAQTTPSPAVATTTGGTESNNTGTPAPVIPMVPPQPAPDPKRQTSRISLESVLGNENESGPKTIKLKRPGSGGTVKIQGMESPAQADARRQSAPVELPTTSAAEDDAPETQKKTIKVKRPSGRPALRTGSSGGAGDSAAAGSGTPAMFAPPAKALAAADSAHWFFIVTGCAATIIIGVLIYVLCAQAFGPNLSLTELSYGAPDAELPWPGRIAR